ncbi:hypothetical protein B0H17DRAFT_1183784 [Mycena rosella]|uniref:Uncharacterized protein n=1 Tax=Mycena rosella TaxID=1033263 RepID=A0AAD7CYD1_MYCRO|nr:hypothetical protein B0H17DRAFT_1183784 [Mycena rosella]
MHISLICDLRMDVQRLKDNLNLPSALEIISEALRLRLKSESQAYYQPAGAKPCLAPGVQSVLDAIGKGSFDVIWQRALRGRTSGGGRGSRIGGRGYNRKHQRSTGEPVRRALKTLL